VALNAPKPDEVPSGVRGNRDEAMIVRQHEPIRELNPLLLARQSLSQMDVPTRQAFMAEIFDEEERVRAFARD